jgi:membrane protease YdiL (CAAX protease family)
MAELAAASGPVCGATLFVALSGGRLPRARPAGRLVPLAIRWASIVSLAAVEELVWRGLALAWLLPALGPIAALLLTSVGFALWHGPVLGRRCAVHVVTGAGFGSAFLVGGLLAAVLAHAIYNVLVDWALHSEPVHTEHMHAERTGP